MKCIWGDKEETFDGGDCMNGVHTFVTCINCGESCDRCIFELPAKNQVRECVPSTAEDLMDIKIGQAMYLNLREERARMLAEALETGVTTFGPVTIDFREIKE